MGYASCSILRRSAVACALMLLSLATALPAWAGEVQRITFASVLLGRDYAYTIYLPDGYAEANRPYPVVYLLHGASGDETHWPERGNIKAVMDGLIASGKVPPTVVVMPGHTAMWWVDGQGEPAESVLLKELLPHVEGNFQVSREPSARAVAGLSAGGYGTIRLILQYPGMFAAAAALSPAIYNNPYPPEASSARRDPPFQKNGKFDKNVWRKLNWPPLIDGYKTQPIRVPLYIDSGDHDRFDIAFEAADFYRVMRQIQPDRVELRIVDGDHDWAVWSATIGEAITYMSKFMTAPGQ